MTGDVAIHEMVWRPRFKTAPLQAAKRRSELWFVNTRFSCLATRSDVYSFEPRWKPRFITALAPEDRCHLNGVSLRDAEVRYATALGATNEAGGWRRDKRTGGVLIDIRSDEIIAHGLSMPHSPRWHDGKLWVLESGNGGLGVINEKTGNYSEVCRLSGFTRGLDFIDRYAIVGLSKVRESGMFSGITVAEMAESDRCCGVWFVDTRNGATAGFVKFVEGVQEIFAVHALAGLRWPEVLNEGQKQIAETYELPDEALRQVPPPLRAP